MRFLSVLCLFLSATACCIMRSGAACSSGCCATCAECFSCAPCAGCIPCLRCIGSISPDCASCLSCVPCFEQCSSCTPCGSCASCVPEQDCRSQCTWLPKGWSRCSSQCIQTREVTCQGSQCDTQDCLSRKPKTVQDCTGDDCYKDCCSGKQECCQINEECLNEKEPDPCVVHYCVPCVKCVSERISACTQARVLYHLLFSFEDWETRETTMWKSIRQAIVQGQSLQPSQVTFLGAFAGSTFLRIGVTNVTTDSLITPHMLAAIANVSAPVLNATALGYVPMEPSGLLGSSTSDARLADGVIAAIVIVGVALVVGGMYLLYVRRRMGMRSSDKHALELGTGTGVAATSKSPIASSDAAACPHSVELLDTHDKSDSVHT